LLCDRALMAGATARMHRITPGLIDEAAQTLGLRVPVEPSDEPVRRFPLRAVAALAVLLVALVMFFTLPLGSSPDPAAMAPPRPPLARTTPARAKAIPSPDFLLPPMPPRPYKENP